MYCYTAQQLVKHVYEMPAVRITSVVRTVFSAAATVRDSKEYYQYKSVNAVHR